MSLLKRPSPPALVTCASLLATAALLVGGRAAEWLFAGLASVFPALLITLASPRAGRGQRALIAALAALLGLSTVALFALSGRGPLVLGLPAAAWVFLLGFGLLPLLLVVIGHAVTSSVEKRQR